MRGVIRTAHGQAAAEVHIARADRCLGDRGLSGNAGSAEAGDGEDKNESANEIVLHVCNSPRGKWVKHLVVLR